MFDCMLFVQSSLQFVWFLCSLMAFRITLGLVCHRGSGVDLKNYCSRKAQVCSSGQRCIWLMYMKSSHMLSLAHCVSPENCNEDIQCSLPGRTECSLTCCDENFCNYEGKYEVIEYMTDPVTQSSPPGEKKVRSQNAPLYMCVVGNINYLKT